MVHKGTERVREAKEEGEREGNKSEGGKARENVAARERGCTFW